MHLNMNAARSEDLSSLSLSFAFTFAVGFFEKRGFSNQRNEDFMKFFCPWNGRPWQFMLIKM